MYDMLPNFSSVNYNSAGVVKSPPSKVSCALCGARLFREDIEKIIDLLQRLKYDVRLSDDAYFYSDLGELIEKRGKKPAKFFIESWSPSDKEEYISISFRRNKCFLNASGFGQSANMFCQLRDCLERARPWYYAFLNPLGWGWAIIFILAINAIVGIATGSYSTNLAVVLYMLGTLLALALLSLLNRRIYSGLYLVYHHEGGFFKRNANDLIVALLSALLAMLGTLAVKG
jgi:hypothetical protein